MINAKAPPTAETGDSGSFAVGGGKPILSANESHIETGDDMSDEVKKAIAKYKRMLRMQVPEEAVRYEMRKQGHDAQPIVSAVFGSPDGNDEIVKTDKPASGDSASSGATATPTKEGAAKDPVLATYAKMVKVGVPILSALHKITKEGVQEDKILYFKRAYRIDDGISAITTRKRKAVSSPPASSLVPTPSTKRPSKALQRIHWTTVTDETKLEGSLWAADVDGGCGGEALDDSAIRELEEVFADAPASSVGMTTPATQRKTKRQIVSLIDPRRAQNIAIQLAQFKSFASDDEILSSLSAMTAEHLLILTSILPTADEVAIVAAYDGNLSCLGRAEQFFVAVSKVPRLPSRLRAFLFTNQFNAMALELEKCLDSVSRACDEVVHSAQLKSLLRRLLVVGNTMNVSAGRKRAGGISVDSIIKTATKRGRDNKTTVVDHVVANLLKQGDADGVVEFASSISGIENAKDVDMRDAEATLRKMEADLEQLRKTIESEREELNNGTSDLIEKGTVFVGKASSKIEVLKAKLNAAHQNTRMLYRYMAEDEAPKQSRLAVILSTLSELATIVKGSKEGWIAKEKQKQKQSKAKSSCGDTSVSTPAKRNLPLAVESFPATPVAPPSSNRERLLSAIKATKERKVSGTETKNRPPPPRPLPDRTALLSAQTQEVATREPDRNLEEA